MTYVKRAALLIPAAMMTACQNMPEAVHASATAFAAGGIPAVIAPRASCKWPIATPPSFFVQDIGDLEGNWRWTGKRPTLRLRPRAFEGVHYVIDFTLPEATFKETGPVTLSYYVGDRLLASERYTSAGARHFDKPVPSDWIVPQQDTLIAAEIDKMWVSKTDGAKLGFVLTAMGLTQP